MQKVKIALVVFWDNFDKAVLVCSPVLARHFDVEIMADANAADYVFYSVNGDSHWFLPPEKIKIFYTGEAVTPDFNACDYAIGFDWLTFGDRYLRLPNYYATPYYRHQTERFENRLATPLSDEQLRDRKSVV